MIDCRTCGACCKGWTVDVGFGDEVPEHMTKSDPLFGLVMRERNGQCIALKGKVGVTVECRIYEDRPQVCRDCFQGCSVCNQARELQGLPPLESEATSGERRLEISPEGGSGPLGRALPGTGGPPAQGASTG